MSVSEDWLDFLMCLGESYKQIQLELEFVLKYELNLLGWPVWTVWECRQVCFASNEHAVILCQGQRKSKFIYQLPKGAELRSHARLKVAMCMEAI